MTRDELLAQAEALEQSRCVQAQETAAELRAQAAAAEAQIDTRYDCSPTLTQCPRCNNPNGTRCDGGKAAAEEQEPVAPALIAMAWSKARNTWMTASRHGTQEAADFLAIAELSHWLRPDPRIAELEAALECSKHMASTLEAERNSSLARIAELEGLLRECLPTFLATYIKDAVVDADLPPALRAHLERKHQLIERIRAAIGERP